MTVTKAKYLASRTKHFLKEKEKKKLSVGVCFTFFIVPLIGVSTWAISSACKTELAAFTDWMSFLPSKPM